MDRGADDRGLLSELDETVHAARVYLEAGRADGRALVDRFANDFKWVGV